MAHFAELKVKTDPTGFTSDSHQVVERVVVVGDDVTTAAGPLGDNDMHVDGETWCVNFFKGGIWKQTSYNNNFRKQYCGPGYVYDPVKDKFLSPQSYASWALDENNDWKAPIDFPTITTNGDDALLDIKWDEPNLNWKGFDDQQNQFVWDPESSSWVSTAQ